MFEVTMKALKYDKRLHYESTMNLVEKRDNLYILHGPSMRKLIHHTRKKEFIFDRQSIEFYFNDRWYTVACVFNNEGEIESYYCNIAMPCTFTGNEVSFIDLDLDVIIQPDMSYKVIDWDDFEEHKVLYGYPHELIGKINNGLTSIKSDIKSGTFPFDGYIGRFVAGNRRF